MQKVVALHYRTMQILITGDELVEASINRTTSHIKTTLYVKTTLKMITTSKMDITSNMREDNIKFEYISTY